MPFTPLHMGPGLVIKAALGSRMSVVAFGLAQVAIDIEVLLAAALDWTVLHGWSHTYVGATLIAAAVTAVARKPSLWIVRRWNQELRHHKLDRFQSPETLTLGQVAAGAFIGTYSHVAIDSIMHSDMLPLAPLSNANVLLGLASYHELTAACGILVLVGIAGWIFWGRLRT